MTAEPLTAEECVAAQALCDKDYNEADREFYHAARSLLPRALATIAQAQAIADALQDGAYINGAKHIYSFPPEMQHDALAAVVTARAGYLRPIKEKRDAERAERARAVRKES